VSGTSGLIDGGHDPVPVGRTCTAICNDVEGRSGDPFTLISCTGPTTPATGDEPTAHCKGSLRHCHDACGLPGT
jgi:hypothetical protein